MKIIYKSLKDIKPYEKNPRKNDKAVQAVAESIKEFGWKVPIVIDKEGVIVAGHTRYKAAKKLKMKEVPCILADDLTEEQVKAYRLADNRTAELADWDLELLSVELSDIIELDMSLFGFNIEEPKEKQVEAHEDNFDCTPPDEPKAKMGDIYKLGNHRLMCGDSTSAEAVATLMNGELATLVHTDPPYGMGKENEGVLNDNLNYDDLLEFNKKWIPLSFKSLKSNGSWYCWGIDEPLMDIYSNILKPMLRRKEITWRNLITWDKGHGQGQLSELFRSYARADEKCLFVMCGVQGFSNNTEDYYEGFEPIRGYLEAEAKRVGLTGKKLKEICGVGMYSHWFTKAQWVFIPEEHYKKLQAYYASEAFKREYDALKQEYDALKQEYDALKQEWYKTRAYFNNTHDNMNNVWHFPRTDTEERKLTGGHATPKPIALCARAIKSSSEEGDLVLDLFGGSGSTLIACEQLNRTCYMMELDPRYVDVIIARWEALTGKKAEKLSTEEV